MEAEGWSSSGTMRIDMVRMVVHQQPPVGIDLATQVAESAEISTADGCWPVIATTTQLRLARCSRLRQCAILLGLSGGGNGVEVTVKETPARLASII